MALAAGMNMIDGAHGVLEVYIWPGSGRPVVAVHGIDGNHDAWAGVAAELAGDRPLVAIALRGRGGSSPDGPFGVAAHAEDLVSLVHEVSRDPMFSVDADGVDLLAHSFGCHVVTQAAAAHPGLVRSLVLVDGGPPRVIPAGMTPAQLVAAALENILPNLGTKPYPVSEAAVRADFISMVPDASRSNALFEVSEPVHLLRAESGMAPGLPPVITDSVVADLVRAGIGISHEVVAGTTHFSILASPKIAAALRSS